MRISRRFILGALSMTIGKEAVGSAAVAQDPQPNGLPTWNSPVPGREYQTSDRELFVASDGSNSNDGRLEFPFADPAAAYDYALRRFDLGGNKLKIKILDNLSTEGWDFIGDIPGSRGSASVIIEGNISNPELVSLTCTKPGFHLFFAQSGARFTCQGFTGRTTNNGGDCVIAVGDGEVHYGRIIFGQAHIHADAAGNRSQIRMIAPCSVLAEPFYSHVIVETGACSFLGNRVDLIKSDSGQWPTWSNAFVQADGSALIDTVTACSYTGQGSGVRYHSIMNSTIMGTKGNQNCFPGDQAGYCDTTSFYG